MSDGLGAELEGAGETPLKYVERGRPGAAPPLVPGPSSRTPFPRPPLVSNGREHAGTAPTRTRRPTFLTFSPPCLGDEEIAEVIDTLRSGWITTGPKTKRFEAAFRARFGASEALALSSCTAGLHTALVALGVGPGDEVITTPLTFCASAHVIEHTGARTVLADIEPDTLNLSADAVEAAITPRTKAILPVHFAGHPVELDRFRELCARYKLALVEDAAHACPAKYRGRFIGSGENPVAFSFYATKNLTTGEGGMLTGSPEFVAHARLLSLHGMSRDAWRRYAQGGSWRYDVIDAGFKYNMTDIQAALGLAQLGKLDVFQERRRRLVEAYQAAFAGVDVLETPVERPEVEHAWQLYVLRLQPEALRIGRDQFIEELAARNIGTSVHFIPLHLHSYYRERYGLTAGLFPITESAFERMISLPLHPGLQQADQDDVIEAVLDVVRTFQR